MCVCVHLKLVSNCSSSYGCKLTHKQKIEPLSSGKLIKKFSKFTPNQWLGTQTLTKCHRSHPHSSRSVHLAQIDNCVQSAIFLSEYFTWYINKMFPLWIIRLQRLANMKGHCHGMISNANIQRYQGPEAHFERRTRSILAHLSAYMCMILIMQFWILLLIR